MRSISKIALVTGGSRGLGKNMALSLAKKGINVIITYNSKQNEAMDVVAEIKNLGVNAAALQLNTGKVQSFDLFIEQVKDVLKADFQTEKFDFLINNAGIGIHAPFEATNEEAFDELFNIHLKGVFFLTQKALSILNDGGRIINLSTGLTRFCNPGFAAYSAMKGAIEVLSRYQAKELGVRGITVNTIAPGAIETDFGGGLVRDNEHVNKHIAEVTALGRVGLPNDIGPVVAFLCSEEASWVNGQRIEVSGGMNL
ncbi:NAD(P)-dependent dehydrogenase (short-subunit alcohol dehydrogenase family) [Arcicella aurantiaca]|uniref:NAD(P)-dependent dehydrogenase (Short-subunit alcohol dehydrogenase family) n=1 Tax=Arcicella aurantiaca TaxID=591202 RepID=A0A316DKT4_9BACT|nr:SDR family oxidoreductase [Arcicella aurantiaca]PWK17323.1 NAD(P)-dependent dehydrogenase (short-subunit alcohol dehydrogenase family) [Arcicella aurantiaca]